MIASLRHRGPDAQAASTPSNGVSLGAARLAILDLRAESNQPFEMDGGNLVLSYNGEVYNYRELRTELIGHGHVFRTECDTEVVLTAYRQWGEAFVERLNGMWAFALYDRRQDILLCSRDRFGVKPFFYAIHDGQFLFASEIKALLSVAPELAEPNYNRLSDFLRESIHSEGSETFFASIKQLNPATNAVISRDRISLSQYWQYPTEPLDIGPDEAAGYLRSLLLDALRLRMRSDVPVGSTLSAGVDSSALAVLLREFHAGPHRSFTASFPGSPANEAPRAEVFAQQLGMTPHSIEFNKAEFLPLLTSVVRQMDSPTQCPAVLPLWKIMECMRREKVVVAIEGQGADELLGGYIDILLPYALMDLGKAGRAGDAVRTLRAFTQTFGWRTAAAWSGRAMAPPWAHGAYRRLRGDEAVYAGPLRSPSSPVPQEPQPMFRDHVTAKCQEQHSRGLRTLLHYGDAISMAHSVESRLPFLDYRLVEFGFRLPGGYKVRDGHGKAVLKEAVRKDLPPDIIATRNKLGFITPIAQWFRESPQDILDPVLNSEPCRRRGIFEPAKLDRALALHTSGRANLSSQIFRWLTTELWFQQFIDR